MSDEQLIAYFDGKRTWKGIEMRPYSALSAGYLEMARIPLRKRMQSLGDDAGDISVFYGAASFLMLHTIPLAEIESCIWQPEVLWIRFNEFLAQHFKDEIMNAIPEIIKHMDGAKTGQNWQVESTGEQLPN